ncbi:MAG: type I glyceraldehyde-3-phosphate dehydrogenase [Candidatus Bipolaricaulota bacterium]
MVTVAINGFGRIGRSFFRIALKQDDMDVLAINDIQQSPQQAAYLLNYDSVYGGCEGEVSFDSDGLIVDGESFPLLDAENPANLPWADMGVEVVLESTGVFRKYEDASRHLEAGANKVLLSAPPKGERKDQIPQIVWRVNEDVYNPSEHQIVSAASCTTNSLAPLAKLLNEEYVVEKAFLTTIHSYTSSQLIVDGPYQWKKASRGRAAAENIVPTTTGAATATTEVVPELKGKMDGMAMRVPTPSGSVTDFVAKLGTETTLDQLKDKIVEYAEGPMEGALGYVNDPIVSRDCLKNPHSSLVDMTSTDLIQGDLAKLIAFYDNEWGYASRLADLAVFL